MIEPSDRPADPPRPPAAPGLRHDLSSPLTVIRGHAQLARQRVDGWAVPPDDLERLEAHLLAIEHAVDRIVDLLFHERAGEADGQRPEPR